MENANKKEYYLGLDIGSGSVGWAVTDSEYNLCRRHGKTLWGSRIFETANTAEERRGFRAGRRRLQRRNLRIQLLQSLFANEIAKQDAGFFQRLKESRYTPDDKRDIHGKQPNLPYALFVDKEYTDKDYHKQFPTIYHLRAALVKGDEVHDVRLVYLAIHHILKHRGHFLFEGMNATEVCEFHTAYKQFAKVLREQLDKDIASAQEVEQGVEEILKDRLLGKTAKRASLIQQFGFIDDSQKEIATLLAGGTVKLAVLFDNDVYKDCERAKISFSDSKYDEYVSEVEDTLGEDYVVLQAAKALYDWAILDEVLAGQQFISEAKVNVYEKHKRDLLRLKKLLKVNNSEMYSTVFGPSDKMNNYSAYIGVCKVNGKKAAMQDKACSKDDFYDFLKKLLWKLDQTAEVEAILEEITQGNFLPRQVTKDNGVIPQQLHFAELEKIIFHAEKYLPFLKEKDAEGYTVSNKIKDIFQFKIPYYVGPLNTYHQKGKNGFAWMVRKEEGEIFPWNFANKVDMEKSAEAFIRCMTNKCTYLLDQDVLPKESLLYSKFMVLNEINNLRADGQLIPVEWKQKIYEDVFCRYKKVTQKRIKEYLLRSGYIAKECELSGVDGDFKASMKTYIDLKELLSTTSLQEQDWEAIILDISLFGEDERLLKNRLKKRYAELSDKQIKRLSELKYNGWGRLSRKFLEDILAPAPETGEAVSLIRALWETQHNLMQLLGGDYMYQEVLQDYNQQLQQEYTLNYQTIKELPVSPAVKRQILQTTLIVKEIQKVMGGEPKRIFIEMARDIAGEKKGKRTESRKSRLLELYKSCKKEEGELYSRIEDTKDENKFRSDKLFLYYMQKGRCMYSGKKIELEDLYKDNLYDIDHIYPQSKVMDDSMDNRVLVCKALNADKSDKYPIDEACRKKQGAFWSALEQTGFISKEKYHRLTRSFPFEEGELAGFIARQLVETRQSTKAVAELLQSCMKDTEIIYSKAAVISQFRQRFDITKVREVNDLHHAKDAYLNIVVGNVYYVKFTKDASWYIKKYPGRTYNLKELFTQGTVERNKEVAWKENETIKQVLRNVRRNDVLVTRRSYEVKGGLFDQQLMKKGKGQIPIKGSEERLCNIEKYGGYNKAAGAYFCLVESLDKKGQAVRSIEFVPVYKAAEMERDPMLLSEYLQQPELQLKNPKVLLSKIKIDTLFKVDGFYMHLSGRIPQYLIFKNANQLILSADEEKTIKKVMKYITRKKMIKNLEITEKDEITSEMLERLYDTFLYKLEHTTYAKKYLKQKEFIEKNRDSFAALLPENQCVVLSEILHLFQCQSGSANLSLLGGPASAGILVMNKNIIKVEKISIINQSPTGIFEQEIDLKAL